MRVGGILIGEGIDHWKLAQEFIDQAAKDENGNLIEKRIVLFRDSYLELHIRPPMVEVLGVQPGLEKDLKL